MTRTIVTLPESDKQWLSRYSEEHGQSLAETIRAAIRLFKTYIPKNTHAQRLKDTTGLWNGKNGDALDYVKALRDEWN